MLCCVLLYLFDIMLCYVLVLLYVQVMLHYVMLCYCRFINAHEHLSSQLGTSDIRGVLTSRMQALYFATFIFMILSNLAKLA